MAKTEDDDSLFYEDLDEDEEPEESPKRRRRTKKKQSNTGVWVFITILVIIALVVAIIYGQGLMKKEEPESEEVAAIVNGNQILMSEVDKEYQNVLDQIADLYGTIPEEYMLLVTKEAVLNQLIQRQVLLDEAAKNGLSISDEDLDQALEDFKGQLGEEYGSWLAEQGLDEEETKELMRKDMIYREMVTVIVAELNKTVFPGIEVTDKEVEEYFANNIVNPDIQLDDVRENIENIIYAQKQQQAFEEYVDGLVAMADVVNFLDTGMPETPEEPEMPEEPVLPFEPETPEMPTDDCIVEHGVSPDTVVYYTSSADWCAYCKEADTVVNKLISEGTHFHIADITVEIGLDVMECFSLESNGVPQFICAGTGDVNAGAMEEEELKEFVDDCAS
ncbi:MAG: SurA N-terminal domain-containing protein [Nanoarchaeota archaeon]|nr:SurA N-terminal domain-containing protein [Nanoarchaeota archaeon]